MLKSKLQMGKARFTEALIVSLLKKQEAAIRKALQGAGRKKCGV